MELIKCADRVKGAKSIILMYGKPMKIMLKSP